MRLPLGISNIFMMRAAVPMRYMSSALGSSTSPSRCRTAASIPLRALVSRTSVMLRERPTVTGVMAPGNSTELRSVSTGSISGTATSSTVSSSPVTMGMTRWLPSSASGSDSSSFSSILSLLLIWSFNQVAKITLFFV